ncbi:MAG TPA: YdeI/OmpD-associated family protein [Cytophaga sp.]|nr:YdeI/OmpD-associated family protein [Cytophaga sp.]
MNKKSNHSFSATIEIIGVNPYVFVPDAILNAIFKDAGKDRGKIPVTMTIDGHEFIQTLIRYSGAWRLYLNTPMRKAAKKEAGDTADFEVYYDAAPRERPMHPKLKAALTKNKNAKEIYDGLRPSLQLEIVRYISFLKTEESVDRNVLRAVNFLLGKERFIGRDRP